MAKTELTPEELERRSAQLAQARAKAAANRTARAVAAGRAVPPSEEAEPAAEAEVVAVAVSSPTEERAAALRQRYLGDMAPEVAALFTDAELFAIEREEYDKALAEQKKQALADVRAVARQSARVEFDLIPADKLRSEAEKKRLREEVTFKVRLPGDGAGHNGRNGLRVDGRLYQDGQRYTVPRAVFESLIPNIYRAWFNEVQFRTLDQHKPGMSATEVLGRMMPDLEIRNAA